MPEQKTPGTDVVPPHWIAPGISFRNPVVTRSAITPREVPWFMQVNWKPMPTEFKPMLGSNDMWESKSLPIARPYWRRKYKNNVLRRVGHDWNEVPSWEESGLGATTMMTEPSAPTSERGLWGNLTSLLTAAGSQYTSMQQSKFEQKAAIEKAKIEAEYGLKEDKGILGTGVSGTTVALIGAGIAGAYFLS